MSLIKSYANRGAVDADSLACGGVNSSTKRDYRDPGFGVDEFGEQNSSHGHSGIKGYRRRKHRL